MGETYYTYLYLFKFHNMAWKNWAEIIYLKFNLISTFLIARVIKNGTSLELKTFFVEKSITKTSKILQNFYVLQSHLISSSWIR